VKIKVLEQELDKSRDRIHNMEIESIRKDETLIDLKNKLDKISDRSISTNPSKTSSVMKSSAVKKLEDLVHSPSPPIDFSYMRNNNNNNIERLAPKEETKGPVFHQNPPVKRKYEDMNKLEPDMLGIGEENENSKSSSTSQNKRDDPFDNLDDLKFKKMFKKVKRNENSKENNGSHKSHNSHTSHSYNSHNATSTPMQTVFNGNKKNENAIVDKPKRLSSFDADNSLQNLLNNFIDVKENSNSNAYSKKKSTFKKDEPQIYVDNQQLLPASLSADEALNGDKAQTYRKGFDMVGWSQKSPLKSLDLPIEPLHSQIVPKTRNGRSGLNNETTMNLMQKMLNSNKKRNSYDTGGVFKMSSKTQSNTNRGENSRAFPETKNAYSNKYNEEDLVRQAYRSKAEREDLNGYDCDQCKKV